jgi:hypothetical protein
MSPSSAEVTYRPAGPGHRSRIALVDLARIPDPEAWLTNRLGSLAQCDIAQMSGAQAARKERIDALASRLSAGMQAALATRRPRVAGRPAGGGGVQPLPAPFTVNITPHGGEPVMNRNIGLERRDGFDVGRDPRRMPADELEQLGHAQVSPLRALRLKCLDCCNGSAKELRLCSAVDCPNWPFRMGRNPWSGPISDARREHGRRLGLKRATDRVEAVSEKDESDASPLDGVRVPERRAVVFSSTERARRREIRQEN